MSRLAVLGGGGFIGRRMVERLGGCGHDVLSVVRPGSTVAQPNAVEVDARDGRSLAGALAGCDAIVSCIAGDPATIVEVVDPIYRAATTAGVGRVIHLSSAAVHGQAPPEGTDENRPLCLDQPFAYNRAKIEAEARYRELSRGNSVEVVLLRPAIVYGPGCRWIAEFASDLVAGHPLVFDEGQGICNAVHVDNVVHAVERALVSDVPPAAAFLLNDFETVRWRDLLEPVATDLGYDFDRLPSHSSEATLERLNEQRLRGAARRMWYKLRPSTVESDERLLETALLQSCRVRLPIDKARALLGYDPPVSFAAGLKESIADLLEHGYERSR